MNSKVLIHIHGNLPDEHRPVVGNGLRARQLGDSLASRGIAARYITHRSFYETQAPTPEVILFEQPREFLHELESGSYRLLVCIQGEGLELLPARGQPVPVLADWIAPRLLEFAFQGLPLEQWLPRLIANLRKADYHACCTEMQRAYLFSLLQLAGYAADELEVAVLPLSAPARFARRPAAARETTFVAGGIYWPWIQSARFLRILVEELDAAGHGLLKVFGGRYPFPIGSSEYEDPRDQLPVSDRLQLMGLMPYPAILREYLQADAAVNLFEENAERRLALSFREIDYLRAGVPIICASFSYIAPLVRRHGGGWVLDDLCDGTVRAAFREILARRPLPKEYATGARAILREHFDQDKTIAPLVRILEAPRKREPAISLFQASFLWGEHARTRLEAAEAENGRLADLLREREGLLAAARELEASRQRDLAASEATLREVRGYLERKEADLGLSQALVREKDEALLRQQADIARMQDYIAQKETELEDLLARCDTLDRGAGALRQALSAAEQARAGCAVQVDEQAAEIERQKAYIRDKEQDVADLLRLLSEKDQALGYQKSAQAELEARLAGLGLELSEARKAVQELAQLHAATLRDLAGATATIAELRTYAAEKDRQLDEAVRSMAEKDRALGALDGRVADLEAELERVRETLSKTRADGQRLQAAYDANEIHLRESAATVAELRAYVSRKETELADLLAGCGQKDQELGRLGSAVEQARRQSDRLEAALAASAQDSERLGQELQRLREAFQQNERNLAASGATIAELKDYTARKEAELDRVLAMCGDKDQEINRLHDHLKAQAVSFEQQKGYLELKEQDLARMVALLSERDGRLHSLDAEVKAQAASLQELKDYLELKEQDLARCVALIAEKDQALAYQQQELEQRQGRLEAAERAQTESADREAGLRNRLDQLEHARGELQAALDRIQSRTLYKIYRKFRGK